MKRRILCFVLTMAMVLSMLVVIPAVTVSADTYKASDNPVLITTRADLKAFRDAVNGGTDFSGKTVKLMADIDISDADWTPIGSSSNMFRGSFDGQWHKIAGLSQTRGSLTTSGVGLFGYVQAPNNGSSSFMNVYLKGKTSGYNIACNQGCLNVGTFISRIVPNSGTTTVNISGVWSSIRFDVSNSNGANCVGGILGWVGESGGAITVNVDSCWFSGYLNSAGGGQMRRYGGIVGCIDKENSPSNARVLNVSNCLVTNDGSEGVMKINRNDGDDIGGIVGFYRTGATGYIKNCVFAGSMWNSAGCSHVGYVLGEITGAPSSKIDMTNTYYVASYTGSTAPAGYYGYTSSSYISNAPTSKTLAEIKAMTSGFSVNAKWYFRTSTDIPVPALLAPFVDNNTATSFTTNGTTHSISTDDDMALFAAAVSSGYTFEGHTVNLLADVALNINVGYSSDRPFSGTFNGQGHTVTITQTFNNPDGWGGLFSFVRVPADSTIAIKNVHVTGTMTLNNTKASTGYVAGLISCVDAGTSGSGGTVNITNVWNTVRLNCGNNSWAAVGGMIGFLRHAGGLKQLTVNFESCIWDGTLNFGPASAYSGGLIGYTGNQSKTTKNYINVNNTVVAGQIMLNTNYSDTTGLLFGLVKGDGTNPTDGQVVATISNVICVGKITSSVSISSGQKIGLFVTTMTANKPAPSITMSNFYYITFNISGVGAVSVDAGTGTGTTGTATVKTLAQVQALTCEDFSENGKWVNTSTYFVGSNSSNTSGMPTPAGIYGIFMGGGYSNFYDDTVSTYDIANPTDMMNFAKAVNEGCVYFTGKTVRLTADIDLSGQTWQSIGRRYNNGNGACFRGTFDGHGHSVANVTSSTSANATGAFFGYLGDGAVVTNTWFKAADSGYNVTITSGSDNLSFQGILANACYGTVQITNVRNSMSLKASQNVAYLGGFVGFMDNTVDTTLTISGCVYDGTMDFGNYTSAIGGFVGYTGTDYGKTKTLVIENSMYAGTMNLNATDQYDNVAMFLGRAGTNNGKVTATIRNCIATGKINFKNTLNWTNADYGGCGQVIGSVYNNSKVSYTVTNVYYIPSSLMMTANTVSTRRYLGEIGNDKGTTKKEIAGAHFCSPSDLAALTLANLGGSGWTVPGSSGTTINVPVPTYVGSTFSFSKSYTGQYWQTTAVKSTSTYNGSIIYTTNFYNTAGSLGITNMGSKNANCGVILVSKTKFIALSEAGAINYANLTASGCGFRVSALKYSGDSTCYTMRVVLKNFTTYAAKQSEEYFAIPYVGTTIKLDGARLVSYSAL